jgi:CheY-like chemotaxis protein
MTPDAVRPPEEFIDLVKDALEHLYDVPALQQHRLLDNLGPATAAETPAQYLRRELMDALETLNPGANVPFRSPHGRLYNTLHLRYVEGLTVQETANELGVSLRQAYRDLRRGEESVAAVLWPRRAQPRAIQLSSLQEEIARLETHPRPTDLSGLMQQAQKAVDPLARQHGLGLVASGPAEPVMINTDPVIAHQVLVNIFSHVVKQAQPEIVNLTWGGSDGGVFVMLNYTPIPDPARLAAVNPVVGQLTERLGWRLEHGPLTNQRQSITLHMATHGPTVLVVDDNEGLVELLGRYLTGHNCRVTAARSGQEGLALAQNLLPKAIILDVMMPEMDGWEFLQRLRAMPQTAAIPVIICSVFNDPELAYSLGASVSLPKPVSRQDVLEALRGLGVV